MRWEVSSKDSLASAGADRDRVDEFCTVAYCDCVDEFAFGGIDLKSFADAGDVSDVVHLEGAEESIARAGVAADEGLHALKISVRVAAHLHPDQAIVVLAGLVRNEVVPVAEGITL